jgi:hypothetical protein
MVEAKLQKIIQIFQRIKDGPLRLWEKSAIPSEESFFPPVYPDGDRATLGYGVVLVLTHAKKFSKSVMSVKSNKASPKFSNWGMDSCLIGASWASDNSPNRRFN